MKLFSYILLAIFIGISAKTCLADGLRFKGQRLDGCDTSVIRLSNDQLLLLSTNHKRRFPLVIGSIILTQSQCDQLRAEAGYSPIVLEVWSFNEAHDTCTCEALNVGILFNSDSVEIPHFLLGSSIEDRHKTLRQRLSSIPKSHEEKSTNK